MICKVCCSPLGLHDEECPRCQSRVVYYESGVGFWDLAKNQEGDTGLDALRLAVSEPESPAVADTKPDNHAYSGTGPVPSTDEKGRPTRPQPTASTQKRTRRFSTVAIAVGVALLVGVGLLGFVLWRAEASIAQKDGQIHQLEEQISKYRETVAGLEDRNQQLESYYYYHSSQDESNANLGYVGEMIDKVNDGIKSWHGTPYVSHENGSISYNQNDYQAEPNEEDETSTSSSSITDYRP